MISRSPLWAIFFHSWLPQVYVLTFFSILTRPKQVHRQIMRDLEDDQLQNNFTPFHEDSPRRSELKDDEDFVSGPGLGHSPQIGQTSNESYSMATMKPSFSPGQLPAVSNEIRCRSCGGHRNEEKMSTQRSTVQRDDTVMGFQAALMELDASCDELHCAPVSGVGALQWSESASKQRLRRPSIPTES